MSATTTTTTATKVLRAFKVVQPTLTIVQQQSSSSSSSLGNVWKPVGLFPVRRIYCIGRNYRDHVVEMGENPDREEPVFFHKPHNSIVDTMVRKEVWYPPQTSNLHYEGELVVAIGNNQNHNVPKGKDLSVDQASNYIYGYALGCDLTRRDLQSVAKKGGKPWCTSKGFDDAAPCGPIVPIPQLLSNNNATTTTTTLELAVNNTTRQTSSLNHMIWSVPEIVARLSRYYTLEAGDLIMTGTPAGVGPLVRGDTVEISCTDENNNAVVAPCRFTMV